jgi:hypothetical protein
MSSPSENVWVARRRAALFLIGLCVVAFFVGVLGLVFVPTFFARNTYVSENALQHGMHEVSLGWNVARANEKRGDEAFVLSFLKVGCIVSLLLFCLNVYRWLLFFCFVFVFVFPSLGPSGLWCVVGVLRLSFILFCFIHHSFACRAQIVENRCNFWLHLPNKHLFFSLLFFIPQAKVFVYNCRISSFFFYFSQLNLFFSQLIISLINIPPTNPNDFKLIDVLFTIFEFNILFLLRIFLLLKRMSLDLMERWLQSRDRREEIQRLVF